MRRRIPPDTEEPFEWGGRPHARGLPGKGRGMSEQTPDPHEPDPQQVDPLDPSVEQPDPDGDPDNLSPRDLRDVDEYEGDPDADPGNMNPREG